jgi:hypothetical protein
VIARLLIIAFMIAHGAIHTGFVSARPPATAGGPEWPFDLGHSWALSSIGVAPETLRLLGLALFAVALGGFALAALATLGILPGGSWEAAVAVGSAASLVLLVLFFHPWLAVGVVLDVGLLWVAFASGWTPARLG